MLDNNIICGDCRDVLPAIEENSAGAVITSPPYNAGKQYESNLSIEEYRQFAKSWVSLVPRLISPVGSFWLNVGYTKVAANETLPLTYLYHPLVDLKFIQEIVWHFKNGMAYKKRFAHRTERWMWFAKDSENLTFNLDAVRDLSMNVTDDKRNNPLGSNPTDYWHFKIVQSGTGKVKERTSHPCQFPEKMIERIILACTNAGDLVVDPFAGSGTTCAVAKRLGRRFLGIEQNAEYVVEAQNRLSEINVF